MAGEPEPARAIFVDVARVYGIVLVIIIGAAVLAQFVSFIAQLLYAIVALLFFLVPERLIERRGEDPADYGISRGDVRRGLLWGFIATAVTIPLFAVGYWVWEKQFLKRTFDPDMGRYEQWSAELDGEPESWGGTAGVWVWSDRDVLMLGVRNNGAPNNVVRIEAEQPFIPEGRSSVVLKPLAANANGASAAWEVSLKNSRGRGLVTIRGPTGIDVTTQPSVEANPQWPVHLGPNAETSDDGRFSDTRGYGWLLLWFATQLLLVALPEEVFYRGFIQTRLEQGFAARGNTSEFLGFTPAIFWTSMLFGIGHLVVPVGGVLLANRMTVFFPALLFGWLRRRTNSVLASTIYHACSNAMVLIAAVHFT